MLAQKQPKNLLRLLSKARFNTDTSNFIQLKGLFKCTDAKSVCFMEMRATVLSCLLI